MKRQNLSSNFFISSKLFSALAPVYVLGGRKPPLNLVADTQGCESEPWQLNSDCRESYRHAMRPNIREAWVQTAHSVYLRVSQLHPKIHGLKNGGRRKWPGSLAHCRNYNNQK